MISKEDFILKYDEYKSHCAVTGCNRCDYVGSHCCLADYVFADDKNALDCKYSVLKALVELRNGNLKEFIVDDPDCLQLKSYVVTVVSRRGRSNTIDRKLIDKIRLAYCTSDGKIVKDIIKWVNVG